MGRAQIKYGPYGWAGGAVATARRYYFSHHIRRNLPPACIAPGEQIEPACHPQEGGQQGRQGWEGVPRGEPGRSTQEMLPCCGCSRNVLEAQGSLASTGAWFLCPPGVTKRDETSELLLAGESLVASCLVGINEKGARVEGAPDRSGAGTRAKCLYTVRRWFPVSLSRFETQLIRGTQGVKISNCQEICRDPSRASEGGDATYLGLARVNMFLVITNM